MIDLLKHSTIADQVLVIYSGPGFYSGKTNKPLSDQIILEKVAEEYIEEKEISVFCKLEGYKVKPYLINCCSEVPSHWEVSSNSRFEY